MVGDLRKNSITTKVQRCNTTVPRRQLNKQQFARIASAKSQSPILSRPKDDIDCAGWRAQASASNASLARSAACIGSAVRCLQVIAMPYAALTRYLQAIASQPASQQAQKYVHVYDESKCGARPFSLLVHSFFHSFVRSFKCLSSR